MKKTLLAIAFGLASSTAFADTGTITFAGSIKPGGTCPIDLVIPGTGTSIPRLEMGSLRAEDFPATGSKSKLVRFALKVTPGAGCVVGTQDGYVTYKPVYDTAGTKLYGLDRIDPDAAKGIALAILDRAQNYVEPNKESIAYPLNLFATQALDTSNHASRSFGLSLNLPLDFRRQQQASFDLRHENGHYSERASLNGGLLDSRLSYNTALTNDNQGRKSAALSMAYQGSQASIGMGYTEASDYRSLSLNASGAVLLHDEGVAFGSHLGETMALVHVPGVPGVGVQNTPAARTNAEGYALIPYLRPYRLNNLVLQTDDLSPEVVIGNASQQVVPRRGAVMKASFNAEHVSRLVLTLLQANGAPVPFGAQVVDADGVTLGVVGQAGQALVSARRAGHQQIQVIWGGAGDDVCQLSIDPQALEQDGGYRLKTLNCPLPQAGASAALPDEKPQETLL